VPSPSDQPVEDQPVEGDALVSSDASTVLAVLTADCAPVALGSPEGVRAAVHIGWRGLGAGVAAHAAAVMRELGAEKIVAGLGPTIGPCCYEFSPADLDRLCATFGEAVRAESRRGRPALDLPGAVRVALAGAGVELVVDTSICTACDAGYFSHRARGEGQRQAVFVWSDGAGR
jgi:copper oxidase (laccase) domain-containing protein